MSTTTELKLQGELDGVRRRLAETEAVLSDLVHERYGSDVEWIRFIQDNRKLLAGLLDLPSIQQRRMLLRSIITPSLAHEMALDVEAYRRWIVAGYRAPPEAHSDRSEYINQYPELWAPNGEAIPVVAADQPESDELPSGHDGPCAGASTKNPAE